MILFECTSCRKKLRALEQDQGKRALCPCGMTVWVPGETAGLWVSLFDMLRDKTNWKCPGCQQKIPTEATACPHCKQELPALVKPG